MDSFNTAAERFIHTNFLARQTVRRSGKESKKVPLAVVGMALSVMACFFVFLWVRIYVLEIGYRISSAHEEKSELLQENRKLRIERASLSALPRVESIAKNKLKMIAPQTNQVVILKW